MGQTLISALALAIFLPFILAEQEQNGELCSYVILLTFLLTLTFILVHMVDLLPQRTIDVIGYDTKGEFYRSKNSGISFQKILIEYVI